MDSAQIEDELKVKIKASHIPTDISEKLLNLLRFPGTGTEFQKLISYIELVLSLPFGQFSEDISDLKRAEGILDKNHYGLQVVKDRILEYLAVIILNRRNPEQSGDRRRVEGHAPILLFVGLVGTGKTSIAYSIAESLGRKILRIPFGGLADPLQLRGQSRIRPDAEPGLIIKAIKGVGVSNPVILLDEIDRVAEEGKNDIMGVLVELLDPAQNQFFVDHYLDFPYDLSKVMFIATANNTTNISTAVMDRLEPIQMPAFSDEEKLVIAKRHLLPKVLEEAGVTADQLNIDDAIWPMIIRPLGYDGGIRSLQRTLQGVARKVAREVVEGKTGPFKINSDNIDQYIQN